MLVAIDSYSYHRFFGEIYPEQVPPPAPMSLDDFLQRAHELHVAGVSLESCFLPSLDPSFLSDLGQQLDAYGLERVLAWGHPRGLESGRNKAALRDLVDYIRYAGIMGARVMRIVGGNRTTRSGDREQQVKGMVMMLRTAVQAAADYNVRLGLENHLDFDSEEFVRILQLVDSPYLGITFDTGNCIRLGEDPIRAMERLARQVVATHIKDLRVNPGALPDQLAHFVSVPLGEGIVPNTRLIRMLADVGYQGLLALEVDFVHPDLMEDMVVERGIAQLKQWVGELGATRNAPRQLGDR